MVFVNKEERILPPRAEFTDEEKIKIRTFMQGAVYAWCRKQEKSKDFSQWFQARDFFDGDEGDWIGTPLEIIRDRQKPSDEEKVHDAAGKDVGYFLKQVLADDRKVFETQEGKGPYDPRKYRWTGEYAETDESEVSGG